VQFQNNYARMSSITLYKPENFITTKANDVKKQVSDIFVSPNPYKSIQENNFVSDFKYNYIIPNAWTMRLANLFAFISYLGVAYGFVEYIRISFWYALIFGPLMLLVCYTNLSAYFVNIFYPQFTIEKHKAFIKTYWDDKIEPTVDIFLPVAGEDIDVLNNTWEGVSRLKYKNINVFVLDDSGSIDVRSLCNKYNFNYLSRPNKGEYKKSGNIQYGLDHSNGEFILVLDADFRPIEEGLLETIPYIASNKNISILQTPQYFDVTETVHKESPIQYGAGSLVEEFYRVIMPSRIVFGSGKCVGTSAIYRRKSILDAGGMPKVDGSEDIRIGLMTKKLGYYIQYLPLIISKGVCPDNIQSYFKQQSRWADGTIATFFSDLYFNEKLDIWTKFTYFNSFLYYIIGALTPLLSFQLLALLYFNTDSIRLSWILPFAPYLIYLYIIRPATRLSQYRFGTMLAGLTNMLSYTDATIRLIFKNAQKWEAAGKSNSKRSSNDDFIISSNLATIFSIIYISLLSFIVLAKPYILLNWETWIVLIIGFKRVYDFAVFCIYTMKFNIQKITIDVKNKSISTFVLFITRVIYGLMIFSCFALTLSVLFGFFQKIGNIIPLNKNTISRV
jgi:cellulose synthase (UDP-forming)